MNNLLDSIRSLFKRKVCFEKVQKFYKDDIVKIRKTYYYDYEVDPNIFCKCKIKKNTIGQVVEVTKHEDIYGNIYCYAYTLKIEANNDLYIEEVNIPQEILELINRPVDKNINKKEVVAGIPINKIWTLK